MADMIIQQGLPLAWNEFKNMMITIWNADKNYIIPFLLFLTFYLICDHWIKRHIHH